MVQLGNSLGGLGTGLEDRWKRHRCYLGPQLDKIKGVVEWFYLFWIRISNFRSSQQNSWINKQYELYNSPRIWDVTVNYKLFRCTQQLGGLGVLVEHNSAQRRWDPLLFCVKELAVTTVLYPHTFFNLSQKWLIKFPVYLKSKFRSGLLVFVSGMSIETWGVLFGSEVMEVLLGANSKCPPSLTFICSVHATVLAGQAGYYITYSSEMAVTRFALLLSSILYTTDTTDWVSASWRRRWVTSL